MRSSLITGSAFSRFYQDYLTPVFIGSPAPTVRTGTDGRFPENGQVGRTPRWSADEERYVMLRYPTQVAVKFIARVTGRTIQAVRAKAIRLGVRRPLRGRAAGAALLMAPPPPPAHFNHKIKYLFK